MPLVSVVMAVRNVKRYVLEAIESVLRQTMPDFELIVVDDGSTDGTPGVVGGIHDARLHLVTLPHQGIAGSLNHGVSLARGRYVALLDGDDLWADGKLKQHVAFMESTSSADLTFSRSELVTQSGARMRLTTRFARGPVSFERMFVDNVVGNGSSVVLRREALIETGGFDESLRAGQDVDMWLRIALRRPANIFCIPAVLTYYRRREGQITREWRLMQSVMIEVLARYARAMPDRVGKLERVALCNLNRYLAALAYETGDFACAARLLARSFLESPRTFLLNARSYVVAIPLGCALIFPGPTKRSLRRIASPSANL